MTTKPKLTLVKGEGPAALSQQLTEQGRDLANQALANWLEILADARAEAAALQALDLPPGIKARIKQWEEESRHAMDTVRLLRSRL